MADQRDLRVSDEQREAAAREIREHFAAGRLTDEELSERLSAAYGARNDEELRALSADLPPLPVSPQQRRAELAEQRGELRRRLVQQTGGSIGVFVLCTVIWLAAGANAPFWPVWVAIVPALMLLRNGWRLYGPAPELERVEEELARHERYRHARDQRRIERRSRRL